MPIELYCSQDGLKTIGDTISGAPSTLLYGFIDSSGTKVCEFAEPGARDSVINTSQITIANLAVKCPALKNGTYVMTMKSSSAAKSMLMSLRHDLPDPYWVGNPLSVVVAKAADQTITLTALGEDMCYWMDYAPNNPECLGYYGRLFAKVFFSGTVGAARCAAGISPLILQLSEAVEPIYLTPPLQGIRFDLMGANAVPPHAPKQISWFTPASAPVNYFLVLPDADGSVRGIDQMFGDNTTGPDGKTPAKDVNPAGRNGYAALAKWDGRRLDGTTDAAAKDGFITEKDVVFSKLRLWRDLNRDGKVQPGELSTLAEKNVTQIDLAFNKDFVERDPFGNETRMKTVVQTNDGKLHLMYDLWFRAFN